MRDSMNPDLYTMPRKFVSARSYRGLLYSALRYYRAEQKRGAQFVWATALTPHPDLLADVIRLNPQRRSGWKTTFDLGDVIAALELLHESV